MSDILLALALIIVLGVGAQWLAWRIGLPSILLLLTGGIIAGPVANWIHPDELFGELLLPVVSVAVALILYEGGLTLKLADLPKVGDIVFPLVTLGAGVTLVVTAIAAHFIFGLDRSLSLLLGAVLVVTGPTVIAPLLQHIRPTGAVGPALKWEGIVIDPIGAVITVLIFEVILIGEPKGAAMHAMTGLFLTMIIGGGLGFAAAAILVLVLERHWVAHHLENALSIMLVVATFSLSNNWQHESGLVAVTVMGFVIANQKRADIRHIVEFKENLRVLLISSLFVVLAARLELRSLVSLAPKGLLFVAVLVLIARPLCALVGTYRAKLKWQERMFLAWMAPRGIVAAAIASVLAIRLESKDHAGAEILLPATFMTIISTVALYGLTAPFVARKLGVAEANPQGILFAGAHAWAREIAGVLKDQGYRVLLVDNNRDNIKAAQMAGLPAHNASILAEHLLDEVELGGLGRLIAVTPNPWINVLAVQRFVRIFGKAECYQLATRDSEYHKYMHGRWLFGENITYHAMLNRLRDGFTAKATRISEEFVYEDFKQQYGEVAVPLFVIRENRRLIVITSGTEAAPKPEQTLISFVKDVDKPTQKPSASSSRQSAYPDG